ncbi:chaplin [Streptomyces sp. NPDC052042]|uniref:chaplin n=1 Tax=Streptomyces sp. NPDC052042 TaxID=3365683 RepID=UPI0037D46C0F
MAATAMAAAAVLAGAGAAAADSGAGGAAIGSPGVLSGNVLQIPVHVPVNLCGNSIDVIGLLNPAFGNVCANA